MAPRAAIESTTLLDVVNSLQGFDFDKHKHESFLAFIEEKEPAFEIDFDTRVHRDPRIGFDTRAYHNFRKYFKRGTVSIPKRGFKRGTLIPKIRFNSNFNTNPDVNTRKDLSLR
ncbi:hypothetical protein Trco_002719 [Trichoderma cornu-damae]|uniref:Uncharacterized protein n=1 Tax=Trichoderma cornu-damae TaxID=654480 RepID=A0A9P8QV86_9HYPO|nr:hypothetical protein Trco_002719 [Trichoderma cornu-damae]